MINQFMGGKDKPMLLRNEDGKKEDTNSLNVFKFYTDSSGNNYPVVR